MTLVKANTMVETGQKKDQRIKKVHLIQFYLKSAKVSLTQHNPTHPNQTELNSTKLYSTQLILIQLKCY